MKKMQNNKGFTLMETLVALAVLAILVMGMGATMNTAVRVYSTSIFQSNSSSLEGILNTSLGDILRYSNNVTVNPDNFTHSDGTTEISKETADFIFTNYEYGAIKSYFTVENASAGSARTVLKLKNLVDANSRELVNTGAYPNLQINDFKITFQEPASGDRGNYFKITYEIQSINNTALKRSVEHYVRLMNP